MLLYLLAALGLVPTFQKTKCKKLLNIIMERIKLLEKRHQAQLRQLHRDVVELLQLKQENKVDPLLVRIWKETRLFCVYAKIAEYCGLVQFSLKDIAAQRECPSGLEEPLAGLCFAASCCADLPELQELREIFAMKYGKQITSSGPDLKPNCHVNQQFLDCLYAKDPLGPWKQVLLEEIVMRPNAMQVFEEETQQQEHCDSLSRQASGDANDCYQLNKVIDSPIEVPEVQDQSAFQESEDADMVQESYHIRTVCNEENFGSMELGNELANRKRTLEDRETHCSVFKKAYRRRKFWPYKGMEGAVNGAKEHERIAERHHASGNEVCSDAIDRLASEYCDRNKSCGALNKVVIPSEDLRVIHHIQQPSQPPERPPPPPPLKQAPPPSASRRVISMPSFNNGKLVNDNTSLPRRCSTMANDYFVESYGSHVHPRLPKYDDLVANFTAMKR